ncbi:MAG TPA: hypothetical protein DEP67_04435 [Lachnospiraceae bacterium]|nr:hypothetical protein [Lachnospiraceae bacterium]
MRKGIRNKFISEVGASLAVALLLFLVCAVVGSVVLAGASASAGRLSQRRQLQQERYALQSAADMIRAQLAGGTEGGAGSETAAGSGSGQAAGSADADAVNIQYAADLLYKTETGTASLSSADTSTGSAGSLTIDGKLVSGTAKNSFAVLLLQMENQICQKLWQTDGALKGSWPKVNEKVNDENEQGPDPKDLGTYVSQSNVRSWTYQPDSSSQNASLPSGNGFVSGDLTIKVGQTDGSTADQAFAVKAEIQADENSNLTIRLTVDPNTAGKYASGQTLIMTLSAQPAGIQYNKQRSTNGSSRTEMNVHFSVSWDTLSIRYQAVGASS